MEATLGMFAPESRKKDASKKLANRLLRSAMGMAAIGIALYKYVMKFSPKNGDYFNRDRFVLSNGESVVAEALCEWS